MKINKGNREFFVEDFLVKTCYAGNVDDNIGDQLDKILEIMSSMIDDIIYPKDQRLQNMLVEFDKYYNMISARSSALRRYDRSDAAKAEPWWKKVKRKYEYTRLLNIFKDRGKIEEAFEKAFGVNTATARHIAKVHQAYNTANTFTI